MVSKPTAGVKTRSVPWATASLLDESRFSTCRADAALIQMHLRRRSAALDAEARSAAAKAFARFRKNSRGALLGQDNDSVVVGAASISADAGFRSLGAMQQSYCAARAGRAFIEKVFGAPDPQNGPPAVRQQRGFNLRTLAPGRTRSACEKTRLQSYGSSNTSTRRNQMRDRPPGCCFEPALRRNSASFEREERLRLRREVSGIEPGAVR